MNQHHGNKNILYLFSIQLLVICAGPKPAKQVQLDYNVKGSVGFKNLFTISKRKFPVRLFGLYYKNINLKLNGLFWLFEANLFKYILSSHKKKLTKYFFYFSYLQFHGNQVNCQKSNSFFKLLKHVFTMSE